MSHHNSKAICRLFSPTYFERISRCRWWRRLPRGEMPRLPTTESRAGRPNKAIRGVVQVSFTNVLYSTLTLSDLRGATAVNLSTARNLFTSVWPVDDSSSIQHETVAGRDRNPISHALRAFINERHYTTTLRQASTTTPSPARSRAASPSLAPSAAPSVCAVEGAKGQCNRKGRKAQHA